MINIRLDQKLIEAFGITQEDLGKIDNAKVENNEIIIKGVYSGKLFEKCLSFIRNPYTGNKRFEDEDAEIVFIKVEGEWYKTIMYSVTGYSDRYETILKIIK